MVAGDAFFAVFAEPRTVGFLNDGVSAGFPFGGGHEACVFAGEVDAGLCAEACLFGGGGDGFDADMGAHEAEIGVAGTHNGLTELDLAVPPTVCAAEVEVVVGVDAEAFVEGVGVEVALLCGDGDEGLKDGARGVLGLCGAVDEREAGIGVEGVPGVFGDAGDEGIDVVARGGGEREDIAIAWVEGNDCARAAVEGGFGDALELDIEGEGEVLAGFCLAVDPAFARVDAGVDSEEFFAAGAGKELVIVGFNAGASARVREAVVPTFCRVLRCCRTSYVADDVCGEGAIGVMAAGHGEDGEAGEFGGPFGDVGDGTVVDIFPEGEGHGALRMDVPADGLGGDLAREAEALCELVDEGIDGINGIFPLAGLLEFLAIEDDGVGGAVVGEDFAIAVEDAAAEPWQFDTAQTLCELRFAVTGALNDLHLPEPPHEEENPEKNNGK